MSSNFSRPPTRLPSAFKPSAAEWVPLRMPAPKGGGSYAEAFLARVERRPGKPPRFRPSRFDAARPDEIEIRPEQTTIWILESHIETRNWMIETARGWNFVVRPFEAAEHLIDALDTTAPSETPHILIVGFEACGRKGTKVAQIVANRIPEIEVVLSATAAEMSFAAEAKSTRIHELLVKPVLRGEDFRAVVANACQRVHQGLYLSHLIQEIERLRRGQEIENRWAEDLASAVGVSNVATSCCHALSEIFDDGAAIFLRFVPGRHALQAETGFPNGILAGAQPTIPMAGERGDLAAAKEFLAGLEETTLFRDFLDQLAQTSPALLEPYRQIAWHTTLVETQGIPRGVFAVLSPRWNPATDPMRLKRLGRLFSKHFESAVLHARLAEATTEDTLTGLANDRYLLRRLTDEIRKASRLKHPLSFLAIETVAGAATPGTPKGRELKRIADALRTRFRTTDLVAHRGGGAFAVTMPHTSFVDAVRKAELVRASLKEAGFDVAMGVAEYPGHAAEAEELLFAAEEASNEAAARSAGGVNIASARTGYVPPFLPESPKSLPRHPG